MKYLIAMLLFLPAVFFSSCTGGRVILAGGTAPPPGPPPGVVKGGPPPWAPAYGYRKKMRYYYVPDIDLYYDTHKSRYLWFDGGRWAVSVNIPMKYKDYDFDGAYKVQIDYKGDHPYHSEKEDEGKGRPEKRGGSPKGKGRGR